MTLGKNTIEANALRGIVDEVEAVDLEMKTLRERKAAIMARAKSEGFTPAGIRYVVKARAMKPHDRQEAETVRDMYMHAMGLDEEPPLFRSIAALAQDEMSREKLIESFGQMCPPDGEIIMKVGGAPVRIWRDKGGDVHNEPYKDPATRAAATPAGRRPGRTTAASPRGVPDVDEDGAEEFGRQMSRDNRPIIENPFPFGDPRRARCDEGWRKENGGDGMGDDDGEE